ncbi:MAG: hypothetical protein COB08_012525 [Rhodobacteraceae bacterium]|nr:hypothetical protein [Paracoccaceae bacterium]
MSNPLLELIERGNNGITTNQRSLDRLEAEARADDGVVDENDEEYTEIVSIRRQLTELRRLTQDRQDEFDANANEWNGLSTDVGNLLGDISTLADWGDTGLSPINGTVSEMETAAEDQRYRNAIDAYGTAHGSLAPMMVEYRLQFAAKELYDSELAVIEERVEVYRAEEVSNELTTTGLNQIDTNLISSAAPTAERDFVEALSLLRMGSTELASVENEIERLIEAKRVTGECYAALTSKIAETETMAQTFPDLTPRFTDVNTSVADIDGQIEACDFMTAQGVIDSVDYELDIIQSEVDRLTSEAEAEAARIAAEREEWERRASRWADFQAKVDELGDWDDAWGANGATFVNQIQGHVSADELTLASEVLEQAEGEISAPWTQHEAQVAAKRSTYEAMRPILDRRTAEARSHEHVDEAATQQLNQIDASLQQMTIAADSQDFIAANDANEGIAAALDTVEQLLRENQLRAEVAAEMGEDPNSSNADVETEVIRRLYEAERQLVEDRLSGVRQSSSDLIGADTESALGQVETDLDSIQIMADGGEYQGALDSIRTAITEMGRIEEVLRDLAELKRQYESAVAAMGSHANRLATAEISVISTAAGDIIDALPQADTLAVAADFQGALDMVLAWETELADLDRQHDEIIARRDQANADFLALSSRIAAVRSNEFTEIQPAADIVLEKVGAVEGLILSEEFAAAIGEIAVLKGLLDDFEPEAENADLYKRYTDTMSVLDLDPKLTEMRTCIYPEADESQAVIDAKDAERLGNEQSAEWAAARTAAYAESEMLGSFESEILAIDSAKASYESEAPFSIGQAENIFPDEPDDTGTVAHYETELAGCRGRMETAASNNLFLEALELVGEFQNMIEEAELAVRDVFQASDGRIDGFIEIRMQSAQTAVTGGLLTAINRFEGFIRDRVNAERGFQTEIRRNNYVVDVAGAWIGIIPLGGSIAAAVLSTGKVMAEAAATEIDSAMDDEDVRVASEITAPLRADAARENASWRSDIGPWFKTNKSEEYKEIGNLLHAVNGENESAAGRILLAAGVPTTANAMHFHNHYYDQLESQFILERD